MDKVIKDTYDKKYELSEDEKKLKLEAGMESSARFLGLGGSMKVNLGFDGSLHNIDVVDKIQKKFDHNEVLRETSAAKTMSKAFESSYVLIEKSVGTTYTEHTEKISWQPDQRFQVWRKIKTTFILNGINSEIIDDKCVRSVSEQPSEQFLKNMSLNYLSEYYFNGLNVTSPVFEVDLKITKHVGPTVKELTTIQKFTKSLNSRIDAEFEKVNNTIKDHSLAISVLDDWKHASVGTIVIWSGVQNDVEFLTVGPCVMVPMDGLI